MRPDNDHEEWFAQFWISDDGTGDTGSFDVGPFDTRDNAEQWGLEHTDGAMFVGAARRLRPQPFERLLAQRRLAKAAATNRRRGVITRWVEGETYGFIVDDDGRTWFASADEIADDRHMISKNTVVAFGGSPHTQRDVKYPSAFSIDILENDSE